MGGVRGAVIAVVVAAAFAVGWGMAMYVNAGAPFADADDAYQRFTNAFANDDTLERTEALLKLTRRLTPETLSGAARAFEDDLWPRANSDIRILMAYWADQDPYGMVSTVQGWNNIRAQQIAVTEALTMIGKNEGYEAARALYDKMPSHARQTSRTALVLAFIDHGDLDDLAGFISSYPDHDDRDQIANVAVERMIDNFGPETVQKWVESLPPGRGNSSDIKPVGFRAAQRAHLDNGYRESFEDWLRRVWEEKWAQGGWRSIGVHWAKTDPLAAIAWARALPQELDSLTIVQETIRVFAGRHADEALPWILGQEPAAELDRGTAVLVKRFQARDDDLSLDLMERIVSEVTFRNVDRQATAYWKRLAPPRRDPIYARLKEIRQARLARRRAGEASPASG